MKTTTGSRWTSKNFSATSSASDVVSALPYKGVKQSGGAAAVMPCPSCTLDLIKISLMYEDGRRSGPQALDQWGFLFICCSREA
mmetsp:Transcript_45035/g.141788  ORF Transcript_45035/g.141788 Transcript_45035/m.141788 type:complete len:84 (+) Transcript_45035:1174-1425(+)